MRHRYFRHQAQPGALHQIGVIGCGIVFGQILMVILLVLFLIWFCV